MLHCDRTAGGTSGIDRGSNNSGSDGAREFCQMDAI
jgi:hypothetical protein